MATAGNIAETLERGLVGLGLRKIAKIVNASDFTDNEDTTGDLTMNVTLPAGAFVIGTKVTVQKAFDDDSDTANMTVGKSAGADEFSDGTSIDISTAGAKGDSAEDPLEFLAAETSVYLRITGNADFTSIYNGDGRMLVEIFYLSTVLELTAGYPLLSEL